MEGKGKSTFLENDHHRHSWNVGVTHRNASSRCFLFAASNSFQAIQKAGFQLKRKRIHEMPPGKQVLIGVTSSGISSERGGFAKTSFVLYQILPRRKGFQGERGFYSLRDSCTYAEDVPTSAAHLKAPSPIKMVHP